MKKVLILILVTSILGGTGCSNNKEALISQNTENVISDKVEDNILQKHEDVSEINKTENTNIDSSHVDELEASQIYYEELLGLEKEIVLKYLGTPMKKENLDYTGSEAWEYDNLDLIFYEERLSNIFYNGNQSIFGVNKDMNINKAKDMLGEPYYDGIDTQFGDVHTVVYYVKNSFGTDLRMEIYTEIGKEEILGVCLIMDMY